MPDHYQICMFPFQSENPNPIIILSNLLSQEREKVKLELAETQKVLQTIEVKEHQETVDKQKLQT